MQAIQQRAEARECEVNNMRTYRRTKVSRTIFRKLPFGALFYPAAAPIFGYVKSGSSRVLAVSGTSISATTLLGSTDVAVLRVPPRLYNEIPPPALGGIA